jgi:recombination protein RecA
MPRQKKEKTKAGKLSMKDKLALINKRAGMEVAYNLKNDNPTEVTEWIPTGSRWLDSIICRGKLAGVPVGRITEIAGMESSGKSYMAAQVAANAQKQGFSVVYFDSESAIDPSFLENAGCDIDNLIYAQAASVEMVLETIEQLLTETDDKYLFVWDSLAFTPSISDLEGDFNPQSSMAVKPRILSKGLSKLTVPIANSNSVLLVLNQLKTNITMNVAEAMTTPYFTPGGKALAYSYSLRIWLTKRKAKNAFIENDAGFRIGSEVKVKLEKSRFGTEGRNCTFQIVWGDKNPRILDRESWLQAVKSSDQIKSGGAWYTLVYDDGGEQKFQGTKWLDFLEDEKFYNQILRLMDREVIQKFDEQTGDASHFYDVDSETVKKNNA